MHLLKFLNLNSVFKYEAPNPLSLGSGKIFTLEGFRPVHAEFVKTKLKFRIPMAENTHVSILKKIDRKFITIRNINLY